MIVILSGAKNLGHLQSTLQRIGVGDSFGAQRCRLLDPSLRLRMTIFHAMPIFT
jgi:hypothetical protein